MNAKPKKVNHCTICGQPIGREGIVNKTKSGTIWMHLECFRAEQRDLKAERGAKA